MTIHTSDPDTDDTSSGADVLPDVGFSDVFQMGQRIARQSAGTFALVWLTATVAEYLLARRLLERILDNGAGLEVVTWSHTPFSQAPPATLGLGIAALIVLAAFKIALYHPLRDLVSGERQHSVASIIGAGWRRVGAVIRVQLAIGLALFGAMLACSVVGTTFPVFVLLPLAFTLAPAVYLVTARQRGALEGLGRALELSRQYWPLIFTTHGIAVWLALLGSGSGLTPARFASVLSSHVFSDLQALSIHLTTSYLSWLVVASVYVAIDLHALEPCESREGDSD